MRSTNALAFCPTDETAPKRTLALDVGDGRVGLMASQENMFGAVSSTPGIIDLRSPSGLA